MSKPQPVKAVVLAVLETLLNEWKFEAEWDDEGTGPAIFQLEQLIKTLKGIGDK